MVASIKDCQPIIVEMQAYQQKLRSLKGFTVGGEPLILLVRLVFQVLFTLPSALIILQVLLSAIIYTRRHCQPETQLYIIINVFLLYCMLYNYFFDHYSKNSSPSIIIQNFKSSYKTWGYLAELLFRITSTLIVWRTYQFTTIIEQQDEEQGI